MCNKIGDFEIIHKSELRFCFWNVGGLRDKLEDDIFMSDVKQYDIILLGLRFNDGLFVKL